MSSEMEVGFAWKSSFKPWKVELLLCKAAGVYRDPFDSINNYDVQYITYEVSEAENASNGPHTFTFIKIVTLKPGIYHFVYRVHRSEDGESDICTSEFYSKTQLASGREVNYIEVMSLSRLQKPGYYSSQSSKTINDSSYYTANESLNDSVKAPLLDYYDEEEEHKCISCCTML